MYTETKENQAKVQQRTKICENENACQGCGKMYDDGDLVQHLKRVIKNVQYNVYIHNKMIINQFS